LDCGATGIPEARTGANSPGTARRSSTPVSGFGAISANQGTEPSQIAGTRYPVACLLHAVTARIRLRLVDHHAVIEVGHGNRDVVHELRHVRELVVIDVLRLVRDLMVVAVIA